MLGRIVKGMHYTANDIKKLGTIVGVWAHPDDEAFSSAGLMATARENGQRVVVVMATRGDAGRTADEERWPQAELTEIRTKELEDSLQASGVDELIWLGHADGKLCDVSSQEAVEMLVDIYNRVQADSVISFDADGITGHEDHKTVHKWALEAVEKSNRDIGFLCTKENSNFYEQIGRKLHDNHNIYFNVDAPELVDAETADVCYKLNPEIRQKKCDALKAHASQTSAMFATEDGETALRLLCECECFVRRVL